MQTVFITGTDTAVGKTHVVCQLIRLLRSGGLTVGAYKPVCSGAVEDGHGGLRWEDAGLLHAACDCMFPLRQIAPQCFSAPVAPPIAARIEGRGVDEQLLLDGLRAWRGLVEWLFVEGAGGLLSPLSDHFSLPDLMVEARGPAIVVIANRLGCVNHARLTVEALERRRIPIAALVLNEANPGDESDRSRQSNVELLRETLPEQVMWKCGWNSELQQPEGDVWSTITWQSAVDQLSKRA